METVAGQRVGELPLLERSGFLTGTADVENVSEPALTGRSRAPRAKLAHFRHQGGQWVVLNMTSE